MLSKGNAFTPNGFSYTIGTIPKHTKLFHGRKDADPPQTPYEWFAFDPEMSFGIMGDWGWSWLRVYRATRDLGPIVYLDGLSAALLSSGVLDSQEILLYGRVNRDFEHAWDDYGRAKGLCEWAKIHGIEGFVRMNAGFELIWCDWSTGVQLVSNLETSQWKTAMGIPNSERVPSKGDHPEGDDLSVRSRFDLRKTDTEAGQYPPTPGYPNPYPYPYPNPSPGRGPGRGPRGPPFGNYAGFEWFRSTVNVYNGESRAVLDSGTYVAGYGRPSLPAAEEGKDARLGDLTDSGAKELIEDLHNAMHDWRLRKREGAPPRFNWQELSDEMVNRYERRLPELYGYLANTTDLKKAQDRARKVVAILLLPHYDINADHGTRLQSCTAAFTSGMWEDDDLNRHETKQLIAFEHVHQSICTVLLDIWDVVVSEDKVADAERQIVLANQLADLMDRLGWKAWVRCSEVCDYDSVCSIPIWPLGFTLVGQQTDAQPTCRNSSHWTDVSWTPGREWDPAYPRYPRYPGRRRPWDGGDGRRGPPDGRLDVAA